MEPSKGRKIYYKPEIVKNQESTNSFSVSPGFTKQFIDLTDNNPVKLNSKNNINHINLPDQTSKQKDYKNSKVTEEQQKNINLYSSAPLIYDKPRMTYNENKFEPFTSEKDLAAYRSKIYWRCYFNAISCF